jgi:ABC-type spermidine/putrescine transport system permease subunit II
LKESREGKKGAFVTITACVVLLFLIVPQIILLIQSFTAEDYLMFPPQAFGIRWYAFIFTDPEWREALGTSLIVASISTPVALLLGTMAALALDRGPPAGRKFLRGALLSPMLLPHVVLGMALYRVLLPIRLDDTIPGFVGAHLLLCVPYVVITVGASLESFDRRLEEAAQSLGASPFSAFVHIVLPIIRPGIFAGAIFSFITSFDEFIVTYFLATRNFTIPIKIFSSLSYQLEPSIAAVSGLTLVLTAVLSGLLITRGGYGRTGQA